MNSKEYLECSLKLEMLQNIKVAIKYTLKIYLTKVELSKFFIIHFLRFVKNKV